MLLTTYYVYKLTNREHYIKMKDLGKFPINTPHILMLKKRDNDKPENKYDAGYRYRQRRRS